MTLNRKRKSNSPTWQKQFFSIFWTLEIDYFDQNLTTINKNNIILQRIARKANWYMMDLMNIEYNEIYCGQRVLMFNIFNCMSVLFLYFWKEKGNPFRSFFLSGNPFAWTDSAKKKGTDFQKIRSRGRERIFSNGFRSAQPV